MWRQLASPADWRVLAPPPSQMHYLDFLGEGRGVADLNTSNLCSRFAERPPPGSFHFPWPCLLHKRISAGFSVRDHGFLSLTVKQEVLVHPEDSQLPQILWPIDKWLNEAIVHQLRAVSGSL